MDGLEQHILDSGLRRLEFSDSEALAAMLGEWGVELTQLSRSRDTSWFAWAELSGLKFRSTSLTGRHHIGGSVPAGSVVMQFDLGSDGPRRFGGQALGGDDILVGLGGAAIDFTSPEHNHGMNFSFPETVVAKAVALRAPDADIFSRGAAHFIMSDCGLAVARIRALTNAAFGPAGRPPGPHAWRHAYSDILDALVGTLLLPWSREPLVSFRAPHYQRLPIVRRIDDFMRANLGDPLTLQDLCAIARASERAVEYAFRDTYGVGAKQYLRLLRLNQVRRELKSLQPEEATVTSTAHRYGFWHMGHFSAAYRRLFGETPRETRALRTDARGWESEALPAVLNARMSGWSASRS